MEELLAAHKDVMADRFNDSHSLRCSAPRHARNLIIEPETTLWVLLSIGAVLSKIASLAAPLPMHHRGGERNGGWGPHWSAPLGVDRWGPENRLTEPGFRGERLQVSARGNRARPTDPGHELITRRSTWSETISQRSPPRSISAIGQLVHAPPKCEALAALQARASQRVL